MSDHLWGIDLGGTKIEAAIIDPVSFRSIERQRISTEANLGYRHILDQMSKLIRQLESSSRQKRPSKVGIGTPGICDPKSGRMLNANTICLIDEPLICDLEHLLDCKLVYENDANCFALAEAVLGAGQGFDVVFGVILGTGVGGGIAIDGKVFGGKQGIAGEWGHNVLDPSGELCYCGKRGCVETVLSGPAIARRFNKQFGSNCSLPEIASRAVAGDQSCSEFLTKVCEDFGRAMSVVVNILDPSVIVLGGGVSNIDELYTVGAAALKRFTFHKNGFTPVKKAQLGDSAGVIGAALLTQ